jgi:Ca2+-binding EF-hand superfamily protein
MSALLAAQGQSGAATSASTSQSGALQNLFSQIDANGDGEVTKSEFEKALGAGGTNLAQADHVFSELDTDGSGTVSLGQMSSALKGTGGKSGGNASSDPLLQASTNSNGSTTASSIAADRSMLQPIALAAPGSATPSYSSMEQMIQRQLQAMSFSVPSLSFSA